MRPSKTPSSCLFSVSLSLFNSLLFLERCYFFIYVRKPVVFLFLCRPFVNLSLFLLVFPSSLYFLSSNSLPPRCLRICLLARRTSLKVALTAPARFLLNDGASPDRPSRLFAFRGDYYFLHLLRPPRGLICLVFVYFALLFIFLPPSNRR